MGEGSSRRAHGGGSVQKRGEKSWRIRYEAPRGPNGERKRVEETVRGRRRDAERVLRERVQAVETGTHIERSKETVAQFLDRWLNTYAAGNVSPRTAEGYRSKLRVYVLPSLGDIELQKLAPSDIQSVYTELTGRGLSPRTVLHTHRILREALGHAVKWGDLARNPADATEPPRLQQRQVDMWTEADVIRFLKVIEGHQFEDFYRSLVLTGLRRSEAAGLKWANVDLEGGELRVVNTLLRLKGSGLVEGQPKTGRSRRSVSLSPSTVSLLHGIRGQQVENQAQLGDAWHNEAGYVFTQYCGCPLQPDDATRAFTRIVRESGLPRITLHGLRHAHATLMLAQGVHPKIVSERLGHASVTITLDTYSHVVPTLQTNAAALLDARLDAVM